MARLSSMKGYVNWGKNKELSQREVQLLIHEYEKEKGINLRANEIYYSNNIKKVKRQNKNFNDFCQWYSLKTK